MDFTLETYGRTRFSYENTCLDTDRLDAYVLAAHGWPHRSKVRRRRYLDSGQSWLEISRYAVGLAALHRDPPSNRWHRTLTRHIQPLSDGADS